MTRAPAAGGRLPARLLPTLGAVLALALAAGCGGSAGTPTAAGVAETGAAASTVVRAATLLPGQRVPTPKGKIVLTLTGSVSAKNAGQTIALDQAAIDSLGLVQVTVYEPWVKHDVAFRGVWLLDLLEVAGVPDTASTVRITALDDYSVDLTMADVRSGGIMLVTKAGDGTAIAVADGGPTRIVFLKGVRAGANADQWIWSLKTIEFR